MQDLRPTSQPPSPSRRRISLFALTNTPRSPGRNGSASTVIPVSDSPQGTYRSSHYNPGMDSIHALRYAVYCKEKNFLDPSKYPDGKEYDLFDDYSVNFAAYSRKGEIVGIEGAPGSGKTTLLHVMLGLVEPASAGTMPC